MATGLSFETMKHGDTMTEIPRGKIIGKVTGGPPLTEAEHF